MYLKKAQTVTHLEAGMRIDVNEAPWKWFSVPLMFTLFYLFGSWGWGGAWFPPFLDEEPLRCYNSGGL